MGMKANSCSPMSALRSPMSPNATKAVGARSLRSCLRTWFIAVDPSFRPNHNANRRLTNFEIARGGLKIDADLHDRRISSSQVWNREGEARHSGICPLRQGERARHPNVPGVATGGRSYALCSFFYFRE